MVSDVLQSGFGQRLGRPGNIWLTPLLAAASYYLAAELAFLIGTLSDRIFAPFWPPNTVLFCAFLVSPRSRWLGIVAAALPAHLLAELQVGMEPVPLMLAFATNCGVAILNASVLRWLSGPPWFGSLRKAALYIATTAGINPAVVAFAGAFVPIAGTASVSDFPYFWSTWYTGNALASLTLGPMFLTWMHGERRTAWATLFREHFEPVLFATTLLAACIVSLEVSVQLADSAFRPAIIYLPLPIILWGAVRFGERGASSAILILTVVSISLTLKGQSPFVGDTPEHSVVALQLFLFGLAVPVLLLSAAVDQMRTAERTTRKLAGSLLRAQDDERRRIARDIHDSTAQNLVAASLLGESLVATLSARERRVFEKLDEMLQQSAKELRLLSYVLHPPQLDGGGGLGLALQRYVEGFTERSGISVDLDISPEIGRLSEDAEIALYRVVQELLTNVDRHSGSHEATIRLKRGHDQSGEVMHLSIQDTGRGFPPEVSVHSKELNLPSTGIGLDSMRERIREIGGRLKISSAPGRTVVKAVIPLSE